MRARDRGWRLEAGKSHRFGTLRCGDGCAVAVWSTPRNPTAHAKRILEAIIACPHHHA